MESILEGILALWNLVLAIFIIAVVVGAIIMIMMYTALWHWAGW